MQGRKKSMCHNHVRVSSFSGIFAAVHKSIVKASGILHNRNTSRIETSTLLFSLGSLQYENWLCVSLPCLFVNGGISQCAQQMTQMMELQAPVLVTHVAAL